MHEKKDGKKRKKNDENDTKDTHTHCKRQMPGRIERALQDRAPSRKRVLVPSFVVVGVGEGEMARWWSFID